MLKWMVSPSTSAAHGVLLSFQHGLDRAPIEADRFIVPRPDTEDEDTEQKIINEGTSSVPGSFECSAHGTK